MTAEADRAWKWTSPPPGLSRLRIGVLTYDLPGRDVNVLTLDSLRELEQRLEDVRRASFDAVLVVSGKPDGFIAGADVDAIMEVRSEAEGHEKAALGQRALSRLATLGVPTIAALHGACAGGGTELALWCTGRVASTDDRTRIGLPEVKLGIVPGFGGTQRLPHVVGLPAAIELASSGRMTTPRQALAMNLVDAIVHRDLLLKEAALLAEKLRRKGRRPSRRFYFTNLPVVRDAITWLAEEKVDEAAGPHYPAPMEALKLCHLSLGMRLPVGLEEEARTLGRLLMTPTARSLLHVYDVSRRADRGGEKPPVESLVGVIGAGVMGAGIAGVAVGSGHRARLRDVAPASLSSGVAVASDVARSLLRRSYRPQVAVAQALDRLSYSLRIEGFADADLVVEAVVERQDVKEKVLAEIEAAVPDDCIVATNTSALPLAGLSPALKRPERLVGLHFFNPVPKMPLVEVIPGPQTSERTVQRARGWAKALGKHPVVVKDSPGFLVNRLLMPYLAEALAILGEGVSIEDVDAAASEFGMPMGPFRLLDEVGIDVAAHVSRTFAQAFPGRFAEHPLLGKLLAEKRLGRKSGQGFYTWPRKGSDDDPKPWRGLPRAKRELPADVLQSRLFLRMADEAFRCLHEGVAASPHDVDLATVFGIGFPPFRGGLLWWVAAVSPRELLSRMEGLRAQHGARFEACDRLRRAAADGLAHENF